MLNSILSGISHPESQRDSIIQPRVATKELPWAVMFRAFSPRVAEVPTVNVGEPERLGFVFWIWSAIYVLDHVVEYLTEKRCMLWYRDSAVTHSATLVLCCLLQ